MEDIEDLRRRFRPNRIATLFVGESPPQSGKFFYKADSLLDRYMKESLKGFLIEGNDFLEAFKAVGFFLDDLVLFPIDKSGPKERERLRWEGVEHLACRMRQNQPRAIVVVMCAIEPMVRSAAKSAALDVPLYVTAFPSRPEHQSRFKRDMTEFFSKLPTVSG